MTEHREYCTVKQSDVSLLSFGAIDGEQRHLTNVPSDKRNTVVQQ